MPHQSIAFGTAILTVAVIAGCGSPKPPSAPLPQSGVWDTSLFSDAGGRPPIVTSHVRMGDEVLFLIVPDFLRAGGGGGQSQSYEVRFHGNMVLPDGKTQLTYHAETVNGVVEKVTIADQTFDLKDGRTFFLSTKGEVKVTQLDHDTRKLATKPKDSKELEAFLLSIPEFEDFLPSAEKLP